MERRGNWWRKREEKRANDVKGPESQDKVPDWVKLPVHPFHHPFPNFRLLTPPSAFDPGHARSHDITESLNLLNKHSQLANVLPTACYTAQRFQKATEERKDKVCIVKACGPVDHNEESRFRNRSEMMKDQVMIGEQKEMEGNLRDNHAFNMKDDDKEEMSEMAVP